ncbi:MAG TPA: DUF5668 domain-containing protein [Vicinamibacterales bacterium]|nr:DUF5668 domain-containing protein [Vicinamibacterales bacterium]
MATDRDDSRWITGTLLIVLGLVLLAGRFDDYFDWQLRGLWPLLLIAFGAMRLWTTRGDERRGAGLMLLSTGLILLLHTQHVFHLRQSWPLFIVAGGLSILLRAWGGPAGPGSGGRS